MRVVSLLAVALLTLFEQRIPAFAQQSPDGSALLKHSAEALKSYRTYQYTQATSTGEATGMDLTMKVQGTNAGKMRVEMTIGSMGGATIISDGENTWTYMAMLKRYMKMADGDDATAIFGAGFGNAKMPGAAESNANAKVLRSEVLEVDGQPHDCWVVESREDEMTTAHWIDKTLGLGLKSVASGKTSVPLSENRVEIHATTTFHSIRFDEPLADSLFVFTPPPDAKEVDELFPGMKAMLAKPADSPTPAKSSVVPPPTATDPQAYVPNLNPIKQQEPVYPDAARQKNVHGMVQILITIDPTGNVLRTEPLTGADVLRQPAADAVQQWKFRPVIRDGHPVYAYTEATVFFMDRDHPAKQADLQPDVAGEMAAAARMASLSERMPRSPRQILADLEHDLDRSDDDGPAGMSRAFALPQLAKAALNADAFDKAASYATELLQLRDNHDRGQAVHDGNMVLGVVSLRQGNVVQAKHYLLESAKTTGSPVLNSFGPNMRLAKELLEKGERDAVLEYFDACRAFWKLGAGQLDAWSAAVREGRTLSFGANLVY